MGLWKIYPSGADAARNLQPDIFFIQARLNIGVSLKLSGKRSRALFSAIANLFVLGQRLKHSGRTYKFDSEWLLGFFLLILKENI